MNKNKKIKKSIIVLPDVSLAAIVRDEMMNPAGGIVDFVDSIVPFVEQAVIVDTGSKDGTREALEELQSKYFHLKVFDRKFDDFASSRNYSLTKVKTKYAFVLDADERLRENSFNRLKIYLECIDVSGYNFSFISRFLSKTEDYFSPGHNPRLFVAKKGSYFNREKKVCEYLIKNHLECFETGIVINHFKTTRNSLGSKIQEWYYKIVNNGNASEIAPSDMPQFQAWKIYNPRREEFR